MQSRKHHVFQRPRTNVVESIAPRMSVRAASHHHGNLTAVILYKSSRVVIAPAAGRRNLVAQVFRALLWKTAIASDKTCDYTTHPRRDTQALIIRQLWRAGNKLPAG